MEIFFELVYYQPDKHLPKNYRQSRIGFITALKVAYNYSFKK